VNAGSYHLDGTVSQSSDHTVPFPTIRNGTNQWDRTKFRTAKYEQICVAGGNVSDTYFVKSNGYAGGASTHAIAQENPAIRLHHPQPGRHQAGPPALLLTISGKPRLRLGADPRT
jgi:hypothetical protein